MNSLRNAGHFFSSKGKQSAATANYESNKAVAKDRNVSMSTRLRAAGNSIGNKMDQQQHKHTASVHREGMKHNY